MNRDVVPATRVHAVDDDGNVAGYLTTTTSDDDGRFTFRRVHPGRRRVVATPRIGPLRKKSVDMKVREGETTDVEVPLPLKK